MTHKCTVLHVKIAKTQKRRLIVIFFVGNNLLDPGGSILGKVKVLLLLCSGWSPCYSHKPYSTFFSYDVTQIYVLNRK